MGGGRPALGNSNPWCQAALRQLRELSQDWPQGVLRPSCVLVWGPYVCYGPRIGPVGVALQLRGEAYSVQKGKKAVRDGDGPGKAG